LLCPKVSIFSIPQTILLISHADFSEIKPLQVNPSIACHCAVYQFRFDFLVWNSTRDSLHFDSIVGRQWQISPPGRDATLIFDTNLPRPSWRRHKSISIKAGQTEKKVKKKEKWRKNRKWSEASVENLYRPLPKGQTLHLLLSMHINKVPQEMEAMRGNHKRKAKNNKECEQIQINNPERHLIVSI